MSWVVWAIVGIVALILVPAFISSTPAMLTMILVVALIVMGVRRLLRGRST